MICLCQFFKLSKHFVVRRKVSSINTWKGKWFIRVIMSNVCTMKIVAGQTQMLPTENSPAYKKIVPCDVWPSSSVCLCVDCQGKMSQLKDVDNKKDQQLLLWMKLCAVKTADQYQPVLFNFPWQYLECAGFLFFQQLNLSGLEQLWWFGIWVSVQCGRTYTKDLCLMWCNESMKSQSLAVSTKGITNIMSAMCCLHVFGKAKNSHKSPKFVRQLLYHR